MFSAERKLELKLIGWWRFSGKLFTYLRRKYNQYKTKKYRNFTVNDYYFWQENFRSALVGKWLLPYGDQLTEIQREKNITILLNNAAKYQKYEFYANGKFIHLAEKPCLGRFDVDPVTGKKWPDISCFENLSDGGGDIRFPWELGRLQYLLTFALLWKIKKEKEWVRLILSHLTHFFDQIHYAHGIQWRDGLQLAIRIYNLIAIADLCHEGTDALIIYINNVLLAHVQLLLKQMEPRSSITNNHSIAEACALILSGLYLGKAHKLGPTVLKKGIKRLALELREQIYPDGILFEGSLPYTRFVLDFLLLLIKAMQAVNYSVPAWLFSYATLMACALAKCVDEKGYLPPLGDGDDGRVLRFGGEEYLNVNDSLLLAEDLLGLMGLSTLSPRQGIGGWLPCQKQIKKSFATERAPIRVVHLSSSGIVHIHDNALDLWIDCGPTGLGPNGPGGHGHNDTTALIVHYHGKALLHDPGWYSYFCDREMRDYFRSTAAHNTITINAQEQARLLGKFYIMNDCKPLLVSLKRCTPDSVVLYCGHTGYDRLQSKIKYRRLVHLQRSTDHYSIEVRDRVVSSQPLDVMAYLGSDLALQKDEKACFFIGNKYPVFIKSKENLSLYSKKIGRITGLIEEGQGAKWQIPCVAHSNQTYLYKTTWKLEIPFESAEKTC